MYGVLAGSPSSLFPGRLAGMGEFKLNLPDLGESACISVVANPGLSLSAFLALLQRKLQCIPASAYFALDGAGRWEELQEDRPLSQLQGNRKTLKLHFRPGPSPAPPPEEGAGAENSGACPQSAAAAVLQAAKEAACREKLGEARRRIAEEFGLDAESVAPEVELRRVVPRGSFLGETVVISNMSGESRAIAVPGHFSAGTLRELLREAEAAFDIPQGGCELVWQSKVFEPSELDQSLETLGLSAGAELTCLLNEKSQILSFLSRLRIVEAYAWSRRGIEETSVATFHIQSCTEDSRPLAFEALLVQDPACSELFSAHVLWLDTEPPSPVMASKVFGLNYSADSFYGEDAVLETLADRLGLPSGGHVMRALCCIAGVNEEGQERICGRGSAWGSHKLHQRRWQVRPRLPDVKAMPQLLL